MINGSMVHSLNFICFGLEIVLKKNNPQIIHLFIGVWNHYKPSIFWGTPIFGLENFVKGGGFPNLP